MMQWYDEKKFVAEYYWGLLEQSLNLPKIFLFFLLKLRIQFFTDLSRTLHLLRCRITLFFCWYIIMWFSLSNICILVMKNECNSVIEVWNTRCRLYTVLYDQYCGFAGFAKWLSWRFIWLIRMFTVRRQYWSNILPCSSEINLYVQRFVCHTL